MERVDLVPMGCSLLGFIFVADGRISEPRCVAAIPGLCRCYNKKNTQRGYFQKKLYEKAVEMSLFWMKGHSRVNGRLMIIVFTSPVTPLSRQTNQEPCM